MAHKFIPADEGNVELVSAIKLPIGKFLRVALRLEADNLEWFADCLERWIKRRSNDGPFERGKDVISFMYGGSDWVPRVWVFNTGENESSISLGSDSPQRLMDVAQELVSAAREAAHGAGRPRPRRRRRPPDPLHPPPTPPVRRRLAFACTHSQQAHTPATPLVRTEA